jgi:hypothetical protein
MRWLARNGNHLGEGRETSAETERRLRSASRPLFQIVASPNGKGNLTLNGTDALLIQIEASDPVQAPAVTLPIKVSADELSTRSRLKAAVLFERQRIDRGRTKLRQKLRHQLARLRTLRFRTEQARDRLSEAVKYRTAFLARVPKEARRFLNVATGWTAKIVPWALLGTDTSLMVRPWGLYGEVDLPFVHPSPSVASLTMLARAALVSFAIVFGGRFVAGHLRAIVDELRPEHRTACLACDLGVIGVVVVALAGVAAAAAELQAALLQIVAGGSNVNVPTVLLFAIVAFMITVSFACGYFLNQPELRQAHRLEKRVKKCRKALDRAVSAENVQRGTVRSTLEELRGLDRQEKLLIEEQNAHAEAEVYVIKGANGPVFGFEFKDELEQKGGEKDV